MPPPQIKIDEFFKNSYVVASEEPKIESKPKELPKEPEKKLSREEKKEQKKFVDTMMYGMTAPIVFGSKQWASSFPEDMIQQARTWRLLKAAECMDQEMCTYLDCIAFFYPMTMDAPMRHEYFKMYCYVYKHGAPDKWKILVEMDPDIERDTVLHDNEHEELRIIRRKIFNRQMQMVKSHN